MTDDVYESPLAWGFMSFMWAVLALIGAARSSPFLALSGAALVSLYCARQCALAYMRTHPSRPQH